MSQDGKRRGSNSKSSWLNTFEIRSAVIWYQYSSTHLEVKATPYTMSDFSRTRLGECTGRHAAEVAGLFDRAERMSADFEFLEWIARVVDQWDIRLGWASTPSPRLNLHLRPQRTLSARASTPSDCAVLHVAQGPAIAPTTIARLASPPRPVSPTFRHSLLKCQT